MPFIVVGVNSLFLWVMAGTTDSIFNLELINIHLTNGATELLPVVVSHFFARWIGLTNGSELYGALWMTLWLGILAVMCKKRIIIKA
jgi:predicted acyltransferase